MSNLTTPSSVSAPVGAQEPRRRPLAPVCRVALLAILAVGLWGCIGVSPQAEMDAAESLLSLNDALLSIREDQAFLQEELDELRRTVARQDSLIRRVADFTGAPIPR